MPGLQQHFYTVLVKQAFMLYYYTVYNKQRVECVYFDPALCFIMFLDSDIHKRQDTEFPQPERYVPATESLKIFATRSIQPELF